MCFENIFVCTHLYLLISVVFASSLGGCKDTNSYYYISFFNCQLIKFIMLFNNQVHVKVNIYIYSMSNNFIREMLSI